MDSILLFHTFLGDSQNYQPLCAVDHLMNYRHWLKMFYYPTHILKEMFKKLIGNSKYDSPKYEPGDSSLRTDSIWLVFVTCKMR